MENTKRTGFGLKLLKVFLAILVPILFMLLIAALFLKLAGLDPIEEAKNLIVKDQSSSQMQQSASGSSAQIAQLKAENSDQKVTLKRLQSDKNNLTDQVAQLKNQLKQAQNDANDTAKQTKNQNAAARQAVYAQTYKTMDPAKAGAIFSKLSVKQAAKYINLLDDKTKASILENMDVNKAAALTPLLKANTSNASSTSSAGTTSTMTTTTSP
ncbi:MotE family protein [Sporolactobacillus kofuensis]|uniref:MotE family protein n=1 Tax=Sporolactobacillus kofuensis TaxID=269672 RepID=A0ABW1WB74_9BACL|nr:hypothetical protein [Sporolactobacillus kofuensis]MCO7174692.1 hypothetical protein [Sporolactobacillus kofuensis]